MAKIAIKFNVSLEYDFEEKKDDRISFEEALKMLEDKKTVDEMKKELLEDFKEKNEEATVVKIKNFKWEVIE